jgi:hypothetical protein
LNAAAKAKRKIMDYGSKVETSFIAIEIDILAQW